MNFEDASKALFGRAKTLLICAAISDMPKDEFTTAELRALTNASGPDITRELKTLASIGVILRRSRRGDYERVSGSCFWRFVPEFLAEQTRREGGSI